MEGVDCVDHQLEETVSKVRARVQDRNTGGGPETFLLSTIFVESPSVSRSEDYIEDSSHSPHTLVWVEVSLSLFKRHHLRFAQSYVVTKTHHITDVDSKSQLDKRY